MNTPTERAQARLLPNGRDVVFMSRGIARNMQLDGRLLDAINNFNGPTGRYFTDPNSFEAIPRAAGGGDVNGSANTANLLGQAGTAGRAGQVPRNLGAAVNRFAGQPISGAIPTVTSAPFMAQEFDTLKSTVGNWTNVPVFYNFVWRRDGIIVGPGVASTNPLGCSFPVTAADNTHSFTCTVIPVNGFGPGLPSASNAVTVVGAS
jgi:hypothetical protein